MARHGELAILQQDHAGGVEIDCRGVLRHGRCTREGIAHPAGALFYEGKPCTLGPGTKPCQ